MKTKANLSCIKVLEKNQWYDIAVSRSYYYVYQNLIKYVEKNGWEKDVKDYREKYKRGSHEGTFEYIFEQLLKIKDSTLMTELSTFFSKLKDDRCDADYKMYRQFNKGSFDISQENFKKVVAILEKIEVI